MKKFPVVLDLETKYTFREEKDPKKLGITVVGIYDYRNSTTLAFLEKDLAKLFPILEGSSYVVGFNVKSFDLAVLQGYYPGRVDNFPVFDILEDIRSKVGKRLSLNDLIQATLGKKKSGHGLMAIEFFKEGRLEELTKYCLDDVILTKELFEHGAQKKEVFYLNEKGKVAVKVDWKKYLEGSSDVDTHLTLPFS